MIQVNKGQPAGNVSRHDVIPDDKKETTRSVISLGSEHKSGTTGKAMDQYKITEHDSLSAANALVLPFDDLQAALAQSAEYQQLELREVPRDGNCFFHAIADVIKHNDVAQAYFTGCFNHLLAKKVLEAHCRSESESINETMVRQLIHGWIKWASDTLPEYWEELELLVRPPSGRSLEQQLKGGFIRNMAPFSEAVDYYGWIDLLYVLRLATGIPINLLHLRQFKNSPREIVSELPDVNALEQLTGDLLRKLREKDPLLVKLQNDDSLHTNRQSLFLVHSGGDHYYPALTKTAAELSDTECTPVNYAQYQQAGTKDKVSAEDPASIIGEMIQEDGRVSSEENNNPGEHSAGNRDGEPAAVAQGQKLWVLESSDGLPSMVACTGEDYSGYGHEGARLVDPDMDDELLDSIVKAFPDIGDWYPAIKPYMSKCRKLVGPGDSVSPPEPASQMGVKKTSVDSDSVPEIFPPLKALDPIKSLDEDRNGVKGKNVTGESPRDHRKQPMKRDKADFNAFQESLESLQGMLECTQNKGYQFYYFEFNKVIVNTGENYYYNKGLGALLYNKAIQILDEALFLARSMVGVFMDYSKRYPRKACLASTYEMVTKQRCDTYYFLVSFINVFRFIKTSDKSLRFDCRLLQLQKLLVEELLDLKKHASINIVPAILETYLYTMSLIVNLNCYSFVGSKDEQDACDYTLELIFFMAGIKKGYSLEYIQPDDVVTRNKCFLEILQWHCEKVNHIKALKNNLEVALLLAGGDMHSTCQSEVVFTCDKKERNTAKGGEKSLPGRKGRKGRKGKRGGYAVEKEVKKSPAVDVIRKHDERFITYIDQICQDFFTSPLDIDDDDAERIGYLKEVEELLSINQGFFPRLKDTLETFKSRRENLQAKIKKEAEEQEKEAQQQLNSIRKSEEKNRRSKRHRRLSKSNTQHRNSSGLQATVKSSEETSNSIIHGGFVSQNDPGQQFYQSDESAQGKFLPGAGCLSEMEEILKTAEALVEKAAELIGQSEGNGGEKNEEAKSFYELAMKNLGGFLEKNSAAVDYDMALALVTMSSWRIEYEYHFTGFFDRLYDTFNKTRVWERIFTNGMRKAKLPWYPKHKHLIEIVETLQGIGGQLADEGCSNIGRALNEQNRALDILQSYSSSRGGGGIQLQYFDDQMNYLQVNQAFFDGVRTDFEKANRNALSAIASRRLIKRHFLPPGYYRNSRWKGAAPQYQPRDLITMLTENVDRQERFAKNIEVRKKRLIGQS
ncbi:hypothetical protein [Endozoicomonas sp.]|uniref:hypothetical protein n=1 Tax=Endozoicomonas sp. TaxID=1892382 RepID=UPI0028838AEE|nr:hypothetical protein [Endozoicomonas sp.]